MARVVKEEEYATKRKEILDVAQRLIYTKGYEQMAIQDILDELKISKGAFYHYFNSKQALLEAMIDRSAEQAFALLNPILDDPNLTALEKLDHYFTAAARWKTAQKPYMLQVMRIFYADENALLRQKMFSANIKQVAPLLAKIFHQGAEEGVFTNPYPEQVGGIIMSMFQGIGDIFMDAFVHRTTDLCQVKSAIIAYTDAMERVLGAPSGSLHLMDDATLNEWFDVSESKNGSAG